MSNDTWVAKRLVTEEEQELLKRVAHLVEEFANKPQAVMTTKLFALHCATIGAEIERAACARIADEGEDEANDGRAYPVRIIARAIRARGGK